jgi:hypothetical protein
VDEYLSVVSYLITLMHLYLYKITRKPDFVFGDMMKDGRVVYINNLAMNRNTVTRSRKHTGSGRGSKGRL